MTRAAPGAIVAACLRVFSMTQQSHRIALSRSPTKTRLLVRLSSITVPRFLRGHAEVPQTGDALRIGGRVHRCRAACGTDGMGPSLRLLLSSAHAASDTVFGWAWSARSALGGAPTGHGAGVSGQPQATTRRVRSGCAAGLTAAGRASAGRCVVALRAAFSSLCRLVFKFLAQGIRRGQDCRGPAPTRAEQARMHHHSIHRARWLLAGCHRRCC